MYSFKFCPSFYCFVYIICLIKFVYLRAVDPVEPCGVVDRGVVEFLNILIICVHIYIYICNVYIMCIYIYVYIYIQYISIYIYIYV